MFLLIVILICGWMAGSLLLVIALCLAASPPRPNHRMRRSAETPLRRYQFWNPRLLVRI